MRRLQLLLLSRSSCERVSASTQTPTLKRSLLRSRSSGTEKTDRRYEVGHFNPSISIACALSGHIRVEELLAYVIAQFFGGGLGSLLLAMAVPDAEKYDLAKSTMVSGSSFIRATVCEALLTAVLCACAVHAVVGFRRRESLPCLVRPTASVFPPYLLTFAAWGYLSRQKLGCDLSALLRDARSTDLWRLHERGVAQSSKDIRAVAGFVCVVGNGSVLGRTFARRLRRGLAALDGSVTTTAHERGRGVIFGIRRQICNKVFALQLKLLPLSCPPRLGDPGRHLERSGDTLP